MMRRVNKLLVTRSLQWQLLFRSFLILLLLLVIMEISQYINLKQYLYHSRSQLLESRIHNVDKNTLQKLQSQQSIRENAKSLIAKIIDVNIGVAIIDKNGEVVEEASKFKGMTSVPHLSQGDYKSLLHQKGNLEGFKLIKNLDGDINIVIWRKLGNSDSSSGLIQVNTSSENVRNILYRQLTVYASASILILIIGSIIGGTVLRHTLKPLYNMTDTVEKITVGQLNMRLPIDNGQLEIDRLSSAFNNMLKRIEESFEKEEYIKEKMRQFILNASHELRTPLTSIHGFVEVLLRGSAKNEKQLDLALNTILMESERLTKLVNDLLLLTKLEQKVQVDMAVENIKDIIEEVYPQLKIISGERKILLQLKDNVLVLVNRNQIKQVIFNLVQNAIQHTDNKSGIITLSVDSTDKSEGSFGILKVSDNGVGISKEDLNHIFDRFFRSESHRSRKLGGYGLGLSIVKSIVDAHNGEIKVDSELGRGTTFTLYLKRIK